MDLKRTSTKPFSTAVFGSTHQGKGPLPDCCSTFGLLGADGSARTAHFGLPFPVTPCCQALGSAPGLSVSKLMVSANAALVAKMVAAAMQACFTRAPFRRAAGLRAELGRRGRLCHGESAGTPACIHWLYACPVA